jgi:chromosome segregation ATPase
MLPDVCPHTHTPQLWRREDTMKKEKAALKEKLAGAERDLHAQMNKQLIHGIESVREIQREHNMTGVYGPLIELVCLQSFMQRFIGRLHVAWSLLRVS